MKFSIWMNARSNTAIDDLKRILVILCFFLLAFGKWIGAAEIKSDFRIQLDKKERNLIVSISSTGKNHFNLRAPIYLLEKKSQKKVTAKSAEPKKVQFEISSLILEKPKIGEAYFFYCDDAKTFCRKKILPIHLD